MNPNIELGLPVLDEYYMMIALTVMSRANCLNRAVGAVLVTPDNRSIIATGYNAVPAGLPHCVTCRRREEGYGPGEGLHRSRATHAEANVLIQAARFGHATDGAIMYVTAQPCDDCAKLIINAGIKVIKYGDSYPGAESVGMFETAGVSLQQVDIKTIKEKFRAYAAVLR